jgi:hypothetical protein
MRLAKLSITLGLVLFVGMTVAASLSYRDGASSIVTGYGFTFFLGPML